jgi:hypothetical protein
MTGDDATSLSTSSDRLRPSLPYIRWVIGKDIHGRSPRRGVVEVFTEVDAAGFLVREIGVDATGTIRYVAPTADDRFGVFDGRMVQPTGRPDEITPEEFDRLWAVGNSA